LILSIDQTNIGSDNLKNLYSRKLPKKESKKSDIDSISSSKKLRNIQNFENNQDQNNNGAKIEEKGYRHLKKNDFEQSMNRARNRLRHRRLADDPEMDKEEYSIYSFSTTTTDKERFPLPTTVLISYIMLLTACT
jgi:hypothetical protein